MPNCWNSCWPPASASWSFPVTLQIISRYTPLIPSYIWTEEMARFLFIWTIMIGAMVGVREAQHFEVDVWPRPVARAARRRCGSLARLGMLALALVFVWPGIEFTRFAWNRTSELADLPLWLIHVAWPVAGRDLDRVRSASRSSTKSRILLGRARMTGTVLSAGQAALRPVRRLLRLLIAARAGRLRARPGLPADPADRAAAVDDDARAGDLQRLQLVHPARGAVLPADRQPDEHRRHHRPPGRAVALDGRAAGRDRWRRSMSCCRYSSPASPAPRRRMPRASRRSSSMRRPRRATTSRSRSRSRRCRRCSRSSSRPRS